MGDLEQRRSARCLFSGTVLAALLCVCTPRSVFAAEAASAPANEEIQEIVVTAQHRVQSLQEVPIAVTVLSGDTILESHLRDFSDLSLQTPSFTSGADYRSLWKFSIEGKLNDEYGFADDPSIAMFVDDVYQGRGA